MRRTGELAREHQTPRWRLVLSRVASSRPVALPIALIAIGLLVFAAPQRPLDRPGASLVRALPAGDQVRRADDAASRGFAPGIVSPTEVDVLAPGVAGRTAQLARLLSVARPGVAAVVGAPEQPPPPAPQVMVSRDGGGARLAIVFDSDPARRPGDRPPAGRCATACPSCCAAPG